MLPRARSWFTIGPKIGVTNFNEFIAYAKANPGKLNFGSTGIMGLPHLAGELLAKRAGISMAHVPYRGGGQVVTDLLSGQVDLYLANPVELAPHFASGLKALAVTSKERSPFLPNLPAVSESGIKDFDLVTWTGFLIAAGTPKAVTEKLNEHISEILATPNIKKKLNQQYSTPVGGSLDVFDTFLKGQRTMFAELVHSL